MTAAPTPGGIIIEADAMPEARRGLAAMPRAALEGMALRALSDAVVFCAGASALQQAIGEAIELLNKGRADDARRRLEEAMAPVDGAGDGGRPPPAA